MNLRRALRRCAAWTAALLVTAAPLGARADTGLVTSIPVIPNVPVVIHWCTASWNDLGYSMLGVGETVSFTNIATEPVVAVRFRFDLRNTFGEPLGSEYGTSEGLYSPNVLIEGARHGQTMFYPAPHRVDCSVDTVKFRSGRTWRRGDPAVPFSIVPPRTGTAASGAVATPGAPSATHPATCKVTLADNTQISIPWENDGCAAARRAFAARSHPATCKVTLADNSRIDIPWDNDGCAAARKAWAATGSAPVVTYDYDGEKVDGHPRTCSVNDGGTARTEQWASEACAPARAQWASEPSWLHARMWDDHDSLPENLVDGHPKYCDPFQSGLLKGIHYLWSQPICKNARLKWDIVHGDAPVPAS